MKCINKLQTTISVVLFLYLITGIQAQDYEHLIIYGQSLSTGHQSWPPLSTENVEGNYMIGTQVWINYSNFRLNRLKPLVSKVSDAELNNPKNRWVNTCAENPLVGAVNHIQLKTNKANAYLASSCGVGGKTIEELSKEHYNSGLYNEFTKLLGYAKPFNPHCPAIVFMQGEYNYVLPLDNTGLTAGSRPTGVKEEYKNLLLNLKNNMQADVKSKYNQADNPLFITYQAGVQYTRGKTLEIGMAQLEASNENDDIINAGPVYPMTDRGGHLDSNGYRWYGEMLGKAYYQTKILETPFMPLQPSEISRTNNPKVLRVKFYVPCPPLVLDELIVPKQPNYGFDIYLNNIKKAISKIEIDGDDVLITCTENLTGDVEVAYAGEQNAGNGNLRDSDPYQAFYTYEDLDGKNEDNTYKFVRDADETTLRPDYEPRDQDGIIYGKSYPLYNFSVAFYYKLNADEQKKSVLLKLTTSIKEIPSENNFVIRYDKGQLTITSTEQTQIAKLIISNLAGSVVFSSDNQSTNQHIHIPLQKGIYIVSTIQHNLHESTKLAIR
ncbi:hypothetical protein MASR2M117_22150 [Paludibacter sp.]